MVLVSHSHRFIFFKSRKTASTSVEAYFEPYCLPGDTAAVEQFRDEYIGETGIIGCRLGRTERAEATWEAHMRASKILRLLGPTRFFRYFRFTTVRNPFAKYLSAFRYRMRNTPEILSAPFPEQRKAFNTWIREGQGHPRDRNTFTIGPLRVANAYIRSEHLATDMTAVCKRLNLPVETERLPHFKKMSAPEQHYSDYFDETSQRVVARRHRWEIEAFGYNFRGNETAVPAPSVLPQGETS